MDPILWLGLSILLVALSIVAVLVMMVPALKELGRAAKGAEKLFETLNRELPPTLEAIRLTSLELTELTDDVTDGVQSAGQVVQQIDSSMTTAKVQAQQVTVTTKSLAAGFKAAWQTLTSEEITAQSAANSGSPAVDYPDVTSSPNVTGVQTDAVSEEALIRTTRTIVSESSPQSSEKFS